MLTREEILARKVGRGTATLPDGSQVTVRGLTRDEVVQAGEQDGTAERDNYIVHRGLVDPVLSLDDVRAWGANGAAGDITTISERVAELSGLKEGADKSGV